MECVEQTLFLGNENSYENVSKKQLQPFLFFFDSFQKT